MSEAVGTTAENNGRKAVSAAGWKKSAKHVIVLPSGAVVEIRIPDLPRMIEVGTIPQGLMDAAIGVASSGSSKPTAELMGQQREFTDLLVQKMVISPALTEEDIPELPYEDKEMLVEVATRQRDLDAEGSHIGGLDKSERFRRFRRLGEFDTPMADL